MPTILTTDHFRVVNETTSEFDRYLAEARGADEHKLAHMEGVRHDSLDSKARSNQTAQYNRWGSVDRSGFKRQQPLPEASHRRPQGRSLGMVDYAAQASGSGGQPVSPGSSHPSMTGSPGYGNNLNSRDDMVPSPRFVPAASSPVPGSAKVSRIG